MMTMTRSPLVPQGGASPYLFALGFAGGAPAHGVR